MVQISLDQAPWIADNFIWLVLVSLFLFCSVVHWFWASIGNFRKRKSNSPQESAIKNFLPSEPEDSPMVESQVPVEENEVNDEGYLEIKV